MKRFICRFCLAVAALGAMAMPALAGAWGTWTNGAGPSNRNFNETTNWSPVNARINDGDLDWLRVDDNSDLTSPIIDSVGEMLNNLWIGSITSPPGVFTPDTPTTHAGKVTVVTGGQLDINWAFDIAAVGPVDGGTSSLVMTGGTVNVLQWIGTRMGINGGSAEFTMSGTSKYTQVNGGELQLGVNDAGAASATSFLMTMSDSAYVLTSAHYRLGDNASFGGTGLVAATGTINMTGASHLQNWNRQVLIGHGVGATGTISLTGDGLTAGVQPVFENIGADSITWIGIAGGTGTLSITNASYTEAGTINIGNGNGIATLNLSTTAGSLTPSVLSVGTIFGGAGTNSMTIDNGTVRALMRNGNFINSDPSFNVYVNAGGATLDTNGHDITVNAGLKEGSTTGGGLTKTGLGTLTLAGAGNNYTGATVVQAGKLILGPACSFTSASPNEIQVNSGVTIGTVADYIVAGIPTYNANVTFNNRSTVVIGAVEDSAGMVNTLIVNNAAVQNGGDTVLVGFNNTPTNYFLDQAALNPPQVMLTYASKIGNAASYLPTVDGIDQYDFTLDDVADGAGGRVELKVTAVANTDRGWVGTSGNINWSNSSGWLETVVPDGTDAKAWFVASVPPNGTTCVLDQDAKVSSFLFKGGYTIDSDSTHALTLQTSIAGNTQIQSLAGDNIVNPNITMVGTAIVTVADGGSLTLGGVISEVGGAAGITFDGKGSGMTQAPTAGILKLNGLNSFTGPVVMSGYGRLEIGNLGLTTADNALGKSSPAASNLVINGILAYTGTAAVPTTVTTDRGFTLSGTDFDPYNTGFLNVIEVQDANVNLKFDGELKVVGDSAFRKNGPGTLTFANMGVNTLANCDFQIGGGTVVLDGGTFNKARVNILFQHGGGDIIVGDFTDGDLVIQNGATVKAQAIFYIGANGGTGNATVKGASNVTSTAQTWVGISGSTGSLTVTGASNYSTSAFINVGCDGNNGTLTVDDSSHVTTGDYLFIGVNGGGAGVGGTLEIGGTSTTAPAIVSVGTHYYQGFGGRTGNLNMSGTAELHLNTNKSNGDAANQHFGWDGGSVANVTMTGDSKIIAYGAYIGTYPNGWFCVGDNGGTATFDLSGNASITLPNGLNTRIGCAYTGTAVPGNGTMRLGGNSRFTQTVSANGSGLQVGFEPGAIGQVELSGTAQMSIVGDMYFGLSGGTGTVTVSDNSVLSTISQAMVGAGAGGIGAMTIGSTTGTATVSISSHLRVGYDAGVGTLNISEGAALYVNHWLQVGTGDTAAGSTGDVYMTGGTVTKNPVDGTFMLLGYNGTGTWNQSGGLTDIRTGVCIGQNGYVGTLNLNGGVFSTAFIQAGYSPDAAAIMRINFDGGTLKANTDSFYNPDGGNLITPYSSADAHVYVKNGGAIIDTSGISTSILLPLEHATTADPIDGGLMKIGGGTLTLTVQPTYTGDTTVNEGSLTVVGAIDTPASDVFVATGATLNAASIVADTLTIGGAPHATANAAAVPEPGAFVLLALAGMVALLAAWRRK